MASYQLKYFNLRGLAENTRILFAIAKADFEDFRYPIDFSTSPPTRDEFNADSKSGVLTINMERVPVLTYNGTVQIGQSKTIERFVAKKFGLMGSNDVEEALIDMISEHVRDIKQKYYDARAGKKDAELAAAKEAFVNTEYPQWTAKLEKTLSGTNGFAVGGKVSLADVVIYNLVTDTFEDKAAAARAVDKCPRLQASSDKVAEAAKDWIANRPVTIF